MTIPPEVALQQLVGIMKRTPMSALEGIGAQNCVDSLEASLKELKELKTPKEPEKNGAGL